MQPENSHNENEEPAFCPQQGQQFIEKCLSSFDDKIQAKTLRQIFKLWEFPLNWRKCVKKNSVKAFIRLLRTVKVFFDPQQDKIILQLKKKLWKRFNYGQNFKKDWVLLSFGEFSSAIKHGDPVFTQIYSSTNEDLLRRAKAQLRKEIIHQTLEMSKDQILEYLRKRKHDPRIFLPYLHDSLVQLENGGYENRFNRNHSPSQ